MRYNPDRDTGAGNIIYFISNVREDAGITPPNDNNSKNRRISTIPSTMGLGRLDKKN